MGTVKDLGRNESPDCLRLRTPSKRDSEVPGVSGPFEFFGPSDVGLLVLSTRVG